MSKPPNPQADNLNRRSVLGHGCIELNVGMVLESKPKTSQLPLPRGNPHHKWRDDLKQGV